MTQKEQEDLEQEAGRVMQRIEEWCGIPYEATSAVLGADVTWLRKGIEEALGHLQNDRKTLAIDTLKATLTRQTW